jgi:hypothetical protein
MLIISNSKVHPVYAARAVREIVISVLVFVGMEIGSSRILWTRRLTTA